MIRMLPNSPWQMSVLLAPSMMNCGFWQISYQTERRGCYLLLSNHSLIWRGRRTVLRCMTKCPLTYRPWPWNLMRVGQSFVAESDLLCIHWIFPRKQLLEVPWPWPFSHLQQVIMCWMQWSPQLITTQLYHGWVINCIKLYEKWSVYYRSIYLHVY